MVISAASDKVSLIVGSFGRLGLVIQAVKLAVIRHTVSSLVARLVMGTAFLFYGEGKLHYSRYKKPQQS